MAKEAMSLKEAFQSMGTPQPELILARVVSKNPLVVKGISDEKLEISEHSLYIPRHLSNYKVSIKFDNTLISDKSETITVFNSLKIGENVHLLALNDGKQYFILDRA